MDLRLATLNAASFYWLHNVSTLNQCKMFSCVTVVCKQFSSYQGYPNYRWDLFQYTKGNLPLPPLPPPPTKKGKLEYIAGNATRGYSGPLYGFASVRRH